MTRYPILRSGSCLALLLAIPLAAAADVTTGSPVVDSSRTLPGGERVLEQSLVVAAPVAAVWQAFTTTEGFRAWAAPVTAVDFRLGGIMESSYSVDAVIGAADNIRNEFVAYLPHRMLAFRNTQCPPGAPFDAATFQRIHTVVSFEPLGAESTRVTVAQPGYGTGELFDGVYRHFEWGNRWSLEKLAERFEKGPVDWTALAAANRQQVAASGDDK